MDRDEVRQKGKAIGTVRESEGRVCNSVNLHNCSQGIHVSSSSGRTWLFRAQSGNMSILIY